MEEVEGLEGLLLLHENAKEIPRATLVKPPKSINHIIATALYLEVRVVRVSILHLMVCSICRVLIT